MLCIVPYAVPSMRLWFEHYNKMLILITSSRLLVVVPTKLAALLLYAFGWYHLIYTAAI